MAIERVKTRVEEGGHNIQEEVIKRRYSRGLENYFSIIHKASKWIMINNSESKFKYIATFEADKLSIYDEDIFENLKLNHGKSK